DRPLPAALSQAAQRALPGLETVLPALAAVYRFTLETPFAALPEVVRDVVLEGSGEQDIEYTVERNGRRQHARRPFEGLLAWLARRQRDTTSRWLREELGGLVTSHRCPACEGTRLRPETRFVRIGGRNIVEVSALPVEAAAAFFAELALSSMEAE